MPEAGFGTYPKTLRATVRRGRTSPATPRPAVNITSTASDIGLNHRGR